VLEGFFDHEGHEGTKIFWGEPVRLDEGARGSSGSGFEAYGFPGGLELEPREFVFSQSRWDSRITTTLLLGFVSFVVKEADT